MLKVKDCVVPESIHPSESIHSIHIRAAGGRVGQRTLIRSKETLVDASSSAKVWTHTQWTAQSTCLIRLEGFQCHRFTISTSSVFGAKSWLRDGSFHDIQNRGFGTFKPSTTKNRKTRLRSCCTKLLRVGCCHCLWTENETASFIDDSEATLPYLPAPWGICPLKAALDILRTWHAVAECQWVWGFA